MSSLTRLDVQEDEDIKSGFTLRFTFAQNDYFKNEFIEKKFHMDSEGNVDNSTTEIEWKKVTLSLENLVRDFPPVLQNFLSKFLEVTFLLLFFGFFFL